ncbi:hypothetical protein [Maricaulis sp.]|uniref:hypothetical protein n=1 Tax=Maricaulis sp. TaxID=1486257 RepID=UPI0026218F20|nr:hypothetical protein [Maricaulis sp.]
MVKTALTRYIPVVLMTEAAMTLVELMIERTPPRVTGAAGDRWLVDKSWLGWLVRTFGWLEGRTDWNRKA